MPVHALQLVRKMRGGAQSHLLRADDGHWYVTKFVNNLQTRRTLINETIAGVLLNYLEIKCPITSPVILTADFISDNPEIYIKLGHQKQPVSPGPQFGSRYPGDPHVSAVYDFVPDSILDKVSNAADFLGMLAFDKWTSNSDSRQCIFVRSKLNDHCSKKLKHPLRVGFTALMIDHGYVFNGPDWKFSDAPLAGLYFRPHVYRAARTLDDFEVWTNKILNIPESVLQEALQAVSLDWMAGEDRKCLQALLNQLLDRRGRVASLIEEVARSRNDYFPNWNKRVRNSS